MTASLFDATNAAAQSPTTTPTWNGGSPDFNNWSDSRNWVNNLYPSGGGTDMIHFAGSTRTTSNNDYGAYTTFNQIFFDSGAASFTLTGNAIKLTANGSNVAKVENNSTSLQTVSFNSNGQSIIFVGSGELNPIAGDLTINNNIVVDGTGTQTINVYGNGHVLTLNGAFGNGGAAAALAVQGTSTVTLNGANTYTGGTTVNAAATLNLNNATALGTGTVNLAVGGITLNNTSVAAITLSNNNAFVMGGSLIFGTSTGTTANSLNLGTGTFSYNGDRIVTLNGAGAFTVGTLTQTANAATTFTINNGTGTAATSVFTLRGFQLTATGDTVARTQVVGGSALIAITGPITNGGSAGGIQYTGTGSLTISGANNTYTGGILNSSGTGKININSATALGVGGTLTLGSGLIDNTSGAALMTTTSNPVALTGDSGFSTSSGTSANNLTINGTTVNAAAGITLTLNGAGSLAFTGPLTLTTATTQTFVFNNAATGTTATTSLSFGGFNLSTGNSKTETLNGSANVNITGAVTNGTGTGNSLAYVGAGTLTLSGNNTLTGTTSINSGTGTLTISGNNSSASGGVTLTAGKLNLNSPAALGTGTFNIAGGVLDNTSGAANTLTTNNPITLTNDFGLGALGDTTANNLTLGTGAVSTGGGRTITLNGAGATAFGGGLTYTGTGSPTFIINNAATGTAATTAVSFGGFSLSTGNSQTPIITGSGNVNITGPVSNGGGTTNGLVYQGSAILILSGNNTLTGLTRVNNATGTLTLSGNNSAASGGVQVSAGKLNVNSATALGSGTTSLSGGTLDNTSGAALTETTNNPIAITNNFAFSTAAGTTLNSLNLGTGTVSMPGSNTITLNGAGALTFGGTLTNTGMGAQTLTVSNGTGTTVTSAVNLGGYALTGASNTALVTDTINGSGLVNITGPVTDGTFAGSKLTYSGSGTLTLAGASTYTGQTTLSSGSLSLTGSTNGSNFSVTGGTLTESTSGVIAGSGTTFSTTGGTVTLSGQNTYTGNTLVQTGVFNIGSDSTVTGGTLVSGPVGTGILGLNQSTIAAVGGAHTINNVVAPNNDNAGTVGGSQNLTFAGNFNLGSLGNHYTTLAVTNTGLTTFAGGIFFPSTGAGTQLTINGAGNVLVNSAITGGANFLAYAGTGTMTLSGTNTYTGPTRANSGTLLVNGTNSGTGTVTTMSGATLGGSGTIAGSVSVVSGSSLTPGATGGNSTAIFTTGALTLAGTYSIDLQGPTAGTNYDQTKTTGAVVLTGSTLVFNSVNTAALTVGEKFYILLNGSTTANSGTFTGAAQGSTVSDGFGDTYQISYLDTGDSTLANDISLTVLTSAGVPVPEPATWFGGLFIVGTLGWFQRGNVRRWLGSPRRAA